MDSDYTGSPESVGKLLSIVEGCQIAVNNYGVAGLNLTSWEGLFEGGHRNSIIIPYRSDQSVLLHSINTVSDLVPTYDAIEQNAVLM